ncbi:MAG: MBL fold metallo-hydrolase [Flavobacteriales bacterium]
MLRGGVSRVDAILYTHEHIDHMVGLDDVRLINFMMNKTLPIYIFPLVLDEVKKRFAYLFSEETYPGFGYHTSLG